MVLEPHRKIIIQDTQSMHGTFVNGLLLHPNETAELQQGTEVTFGAEVTRGDEVYPAKTFRCEVEWERLRSPSPRPSETKARSGYGVTTQELEYESNEEDEEEDHYEEEMDEHSEDEHMSDSSGRASSPAPSIPQSSAGEMSMTSSSDRTAYFRGEDLPESHERTTITVCKHLHDVVLERYGDKAKTLRDLIDREAEARKTELAERDDCPPLRTSTIHSLVNNTHTESTSKSIRVIDLVEEDKDVAIKEVEPAPFHSPKMSTEKSDGQNIGSASIAESDAEEEAEEEDEDERMFALSYDDEDDDDDHDSTEEEEEEEEDKPMDDEINDSIQESSNASENKSITKVVANIVTSEPSSPPEAMSSKAPNMWPTSECMGSFIPAREAVSVLPPIGRPDSIPLIQQRQPPQQQAPVPPPPAPFSAPSQVPAPHGCWVPNNHTDKREFFESRAKNFARVNAEQHHAAATDCFYMPQWAGPAEFSQQRDDKPDAIKNIPRISRFFLHSKLSGEAEKINQEAAGAKSRAIDYAAGEDLEMDEDCDFDEEESLGMGEFCESSSDDEEYRNTNGDTVKTFDTPATPTKKDASKGTKAGYNKFSIEDMMNHESPKGKVGTPTVAPTPASPPLSERSAPVCGYTSKNTSPVLDIPSILNNTPPPSLKRKRQNVETPLPTIPPAPVFEQTLPDAPEVAVNEIAYPSLAAYPATICEEKPEQKEEVEERPSKRVKSERRGTSYAGLAAATMAGFVLGGVGVFAALVASAQ